MIAANREEVRRPRDLEGGIVGVTGLPSDDAVLDTVLEADGADPGAVKRITIGFDSVAALSAGRVDAATAFWNAEGVMLRELGLPTREFRVDDYGAPRYPELMLTTTSRFRSDNRDLIEDFEAATADGYAAAAADAEAGLAALLDGADELDRETQAAQLEALLERGRVRSAGRLRRRVAQVGPGAGTRQLGVARGYVRR